MEELTEKLDSVIQKFQNHKIEIFNNSINTQTIKHYAILLKVGQKYNKALLKCYF